MEEVDNIIIHSLRIIGCDVDEEITSLKQFTDELVVKAAVCCLEAIRPGTGLPRTLPPSMSLRLRTATMIAQAVKDLDYRGDMGYQTLLYSNEVEIRRMFMFLVERLPRDNEKSLQSKAKGRFELLQDEIKESIVVALKTSWAKCKAPSIPFHSRPLFVPATSSENITQEMKEYWSRYLPSVTEQCSNNELIPSLIVTNDCYDLEAILRFTKQIEELFMAVSNYSCKIKDKVEHVHEKVEELTITNSNSAIFVEEPQKISNHKENTGKKSIMEITGEVEVLMSEVSSIEENIRHLVTKQLQIKEQKKSAQCELDENVRKLKIKSRTSKLLPGKSENIVKLEEMINFSTEKLENLATQWDKHRVALIEEYRSMREKSSQKEFEQKKSENKLKNAEQKLKELEEEIVLKDSLCKQLQDECTKLSNKGNRLAYTQRIMEIIANIRKQCNEIDKILKDTKELQKHINTLNGRLERSFVLADEIIFRDAKQDETARKAYKLLATLHSDCADLIQVVQQTGAVIRETRDLQEQVDSEQAQDIASRLVRITADLDEVRRETKMLQEVKQQTHS